MCLRSLRASLVFSARSWLILAMRRMILGKGRGRVSRLRIVDTPFIATTTDCAVDCFTQFLIHACAVLVRIVPALMSMPFVLNGYASTGNGFRVDCEVNVHNVTFCVFAQNCAV